MPFSSARLSPVRQDKLPPRPITPGRSFLVYVTAIFVAALIAAALVVSVGAVREKSRLAHGVGQIIDLVDLTRHAAAVEHGFGSGQQEDILERLARLQQLRIPTQSDGLQALVNPWNGSLVAYTLSETAFRMDSIVPSRVCERIISLLAKNATSVGLQEIGTKLTEGSQREIYADGRTGHIDVDTIAAGCGSRRPVTLSLTFALR